MTKQEEARQLAKRLNQRLVRAERSGATFLRQYQDIITMINSSSAGTSSGKRFKESYGKMSDVDLNKVLGVLRRASTFTDITGKKSKKIITETRAKFKQHFGNISDSSMNDFLVLQRSELYHNLERYLSSDQIMDIVQNKTSNNSIEMMFDQYIAVNQGQQFDSQKFLEFMFKK